MKNRFTGVLICLLLIQMLSGYFNSLSFAQTNQERCEAYEACTNSNGVLITNRFFALQFQYDRQTGRLLIDFDQTGGNFEVREKKNKVVLIDRMCGVRLIATNFVLVTEDSNGLYEVKNPTRPVGIIMRGGCKAPFREDEMNFRIDWKDATEVDDL